MSYGVIDICAGVGGIDEALRRAGRSDVYGIDEAGPVSTLAAAAGHVRRLDDVTALDPVEVAQEVGFPSTGGIIVGGPPCPPFAVSGLGLGRRDLPAMYETLDRIRHGETPRAALGRFAAGARHPKSPVSFEPLRWALALSPRAVFWEQVPPVLPFWEACAEVLRELLGMTVLTGLAYAVDHGVPQTRKRAVLLGSLDPVEWPQRRPGPVVTMRQAFEAAGLPGPGPGYPMLRSNYGTGGDAARRGMRPIDGQAPTITGRASRMKWLDETGAVIRNITLAEAAVLSGFDPAYPFMKLDDERRGGPTLTDAWQALGDAVPPPLAEAFVRLVV